MNYFLVWYKVRLVIFGLNRIRLHSVRTNDGCRQVRFSFNNEVPNILFINYYVNISKSIYVGEFKY